MSVTLAIFDRLINDPNVSELVSDRVYYERAPQGPITADMIVLQHINTSPQHVYQGPAGCADSSVDVVCLSRTYLGADRLAKAVRSAIDGKLIVYQGDKYVIEVDSDDTLPAEVAPGRDAPAAFGRTLGLRIFHTETIPTTR